MRRHALCAALTCALTATACHPQTRVVTTPPSAVAAARAPDPGLVRLEVAGNHRVVQAGSVQTVLARVRVVADAPPQSRRAPLHIALVVDTSGSMAGDAIERARAAAGTLVDQLSPDDEISVVAFHSRAEILLPATRAGEGPREALRARIATMEAQGTTDLASGLAQGLAQLQPSLDAAAASPFARFGAHRVVLLSDGVPNDASPVQSLARDAAARGITITTLGLGVDYDEILLGSLAIQTGGTFHYVAQPADVAGVFRDEVLRLRRVVARNAVLRLTPGPGVQLLGIEGQAPTRDGASLTLALGDVSANEPRDFVLRMQVPARRDGAALELLDASLALEDAAVGAGRLERHAFLGGRASSSTATVAEGRDRSVDSDAVRVRVAAAQVEAIRLAREGRASDALGLLARAETEAREAARSGGDDSLSRQLDGIVRLRQLLPSLAPRQTAAVSSPPQPEARHDSPAPTARVPSAEAEPEARAVHARAMEALRTSAPR